MKKVFGVFLFMIFHGSFSYCQLADGSTAPDFTFTDISGNTQNLYSYLNSGKYVALEISATWCGPCWSYHNSGVMDSMYELHDIPGDQTWKVLFIEGDGNTTLADLQGTGTNTQGNWITGTPFPIINPSGVLLNDFISNYNNSFFPTLYVICPNKKVYQDTLNKGTKPSVSRWKYVASTMCGPVGLDNLNDTSPLTIFPNPANDYTVFYFSLNNATRLKVAATNILGQMVDSKNFGMLYPGDHSLRYELGQFETGMYFFTFSDGNERYIRKKVVVQ